MLDPQTRTDDQEWGCPGDGAAFAGEATEVISAEEVRVGLRARAMQPIPDLQLWPGIAAGIIRQGVELYPRWRSAGLAIGPLETNWEALRMGQWIRDQLPTHLFLDEPPEGWDAHPDEWREVVQRARSIWYLECAKGLSIGEFADGKKKRRTTLF
jgi:hypothetical protein